MSTVLKSIPEMGIDTKFIADRFAKLQPGETITDLELTRLIGRDIGNARSNVYSAIRHVRSQFQIVVTRVLKIGYKRLNPKGIVDSTESTIQHIHRTANTGVKKLGCVDLSELDNKGLLEFNTKASHLGVLAAVTNGKSVKKLESAISKTQERLPLAKTLEVFSS